jgi:hypothetical protein
MKYVEHQRARVRIPFGSRWQNAMGFDEQIPQPYPLYDRHPSSIDDRPNTIAASGDAATLDEETLHRQNRRQPFISRL